MGYASCRIIKTAFIEINFRYISERFATLPTTQPGRCQRRFTFAVQTYLRIYDSHTGKQTRHGGFRKNGFFTQHT